MNWLDFGGQRSLWSHKHIFGHNLIIHTVFAIEIDIQMSNRIKCQRLNALWRHKILIMDVLAIIHHHSSGDDHDTVTLVWIFLHRLHQHVFTDLVSETCWVSSLIAGCVIRRWTVCYARHQQQFVKCCIDDLQTRLKRTLLRLRAFRKSSAAKWERK